MCLKTYPCKHYIRNCEDNSNFVTMSGPKIYHLLKKDGLSDKHFDEYANYVIVEQTDEELRIEHENLLIKLEQQKKKNWN